jgi:hypothetical protein
MTTYVYHQGQVACDVRTIFDGPELSKVMDDTSQSKFYFYRDNQGLAIAAIGTVNKKPTEKMFEAHRSIFLDRERIERVADAQGASIALPENIPAEEQISSGFILVFRDAVYVAECNKDEKTNNRFFTFAKAYSSVVIGSGSKVGQAIVHFHPEIDIETIYRRIGTSDYLTSQFCFYFEQSDLKEMQS